MRMLAGGWRVKLVTSRTIASRKYFLEMLCKNIARSNRLASAEPVNS